MKLNKQQIILLASTIIFGLSAYFMAVTTELKEQNLVLRAKMKSLKPKRKAVSWRKFTDNAKEEEKNKEEIKSERISRLRTQKKESATPQVAGKNYADMATSKLKSLFRINILKYLELTEKELKESILMANELILRNPNVYGTYKGKLIFLLTLEGKFNASDVDYEISDTILELSDFDVGLEKAMQKERKLKQQKETFIKVKEFELSILLERKRTMESEYNQIVLEELAIQKEEEIFQLEDEIEAGLLTDADYLDDEVIEIPFMRMLSKGHYDAALEEASLFLEEFPDSLSGHYFFIKTLQLQGRDSDVTDYLNSLELSDDNIITLAQRVQKNSDNTYKYFWKALRF